MIKTLLGKSVARKFTQNLKTQTHKNFRKANFKSFLQNHPLFVKIIWI